MSSLLYKNLIGVNQKKTSDTNPAWCEKTPPIPTLLNYFNVLYILQLKNKKHYGILRRRVFPTRILVRPTTDINDTTKIGCGGGCIQNNFKINAANVWRSH